jgi:hypothetical protein
MRTMLDPLRVFRHIAHRQPFTAPYLSRGRSKRLTGFFTYILHSLASTTGCAIVKVDRGCHSSSSLIIYSIRISCN